MVRTNGGGSMMYSIFTHWSAPVRFRYRVARESIIQLTRRQVSFLNNAHVMLHVSDHEVANRAGSHRMGHDVAQTRALLVGHVFKQI